MRRVRYQFGSIEEKPRKTGPNAVVLRYREGGLHRSQILGSIEELPTEAAQWRAAERFRLDVNTDCPREVTFEVLLDRYLAEEAPQRHSTKSGYRSYIESHIRPKWGQYMISKIGVMGLDVWLKALPVSQKTKNNIKWLMVSLFDYAMRLELVSLGHNPMRAIKVKGMTAERPAPMILEPEQFQAIASRIAEEPYHTMVWLAGGLGLRCSELAGLQWQDFDFEAAKVTIRRAVVDGRVDATKTRASFAELPVHSLLASKLKDWHAKTPYKAASDWVFASPYQNGRKPYTMYNVNTLILKPAAKALGLGAVGWHTFRHTYRAMLDKTGAPAGVQQKLMRHASITTTMNTYGDAYMDDKRQAADAVVGRMIQ